MDENTNLELKNIFNLSDWFKDLTWAGVGLGAIGIAILTYYLMKAERKHG
jgi:hypothetical protein